MLTVHPVAAFKDNYIWVIHDRNTAVVIDPGTALPVIEYLRSRQLRLAAILITHHHNDHTGGITGLLQYFDAPVYGPCSKNIPTITHSVRNNDEISFHELPLQLTVIEVPGHTLDHIAYYGSQPFGMLFCGDTLFACGCGRIFEGTAGQMYQSLQKLYQLPDDTLIYCAHEYTLGNIKFARVVDHQNEKLQAFEITARMQRSQNTPTIPTTLGNEKSINPFLRCSNLEIIASVQSYCNCKFQDPLSIFTALRDWKNNF
ncbi:hydroxyacylglutathione hydrolase [Nitrosomonas sp.]|uniref:hydroxyacylglutathione hydrolase n=1 Tax=Nitrosomonas sp. TaxID=42353 RepID=UPI001DB70ECC|nr:hydroxyacylglutathione hydrolase [Nitrosomonas sp.]MBX3618292.1 hydroxyacylglutathione hydrolase [Nitrosomonas sp.]